MIPGIKEAVQGGVTGILDSLTNGVANVISKFKKDPTKAAEYEKELDELKINVALESEKLAIKVQELAIEETKAYLLDTQSARDANTRVQESDKSSWMAKNIAYCLDVLFVVSFILMLIMILYKQVPEENKELFYTAFGLLGGYVSTILNFHRGTSRGSEDKGKQLNTMINAKAKP